MSAELFDLVGRINGEYQHALSRNDRFGARQVVQHHAHLNGLTPDAAESILNELSRRPQFFG